MTNLLQNIIERTKVIWLKPERYNSFKNPFFIFFALILFAVIFLVYSNHFENELHFDDVHTIQNNTAIQEINLKMFFSDGTSFSSLPSNQSYRPYITSENAIDYKLGKGLDTRVFHIHIFITFLIVCFLLCVFVKQILDKIHFSNYNQFYGLLVAAIFGLLCANAETVNYIIQRAEIVAGLYILAGFVAFLKGGVWRSNYLYLLFPFIGFFAKEMAFVFSPLLLLYVLIFEENTDLLHFYKVEELRKCLRSFYKIMPSFLMTVLFYIFYLKMLPESFSTGGLDRFKYLITQPMVMCHYILTYFVPYSLSADTDWRVYDSLMDYRVITGVLLVLLLVYRALKASSNEDTKLFSFGILWFFISLLPTSSFIAFSEVLNDHRCFIPYMGLTIAFVFGTKYLLESVLGIAINHKKNWISILIIITLFLGVNAYGVQERNKVWRSELSLWKDVTIKSPNNGRGLMNYGLQLMAKGDYKNAEVYFNRALILNPDYSNLYINLGILKSALRQNDTAEMFYKKSLTCTTANHVSYFYYAKFLSDQGRNEEAIEKLRVALKIFKRYEEGRNLLLNVYHKLGDWANLKILALEILKSEPTDVTAKRYLVIATEKKTIIASLEEEINTAPTPEKYLNLSLKYFLVKDYQGCIKAANKAITLRNNYAEAYNNLGIAYVNLKEYDKGVTAYKKAIQINPDYELAKNNLLYVLNLKKDVGLQSLTNQKKELLDKYINQSLVFYNQKRFDKCIEAAKKANVISPSVIAYNNICSAYNELKQYHNAVKACNAALKLDSDYKLAKGNLALALGKIENNN